MFAARHSPSLSLPLPLSLLKGRDKICKNMLCARLMTRGSGRYFSDKTICKKINSLSDSGLDKFHNSLMFCFLTATIKHFEFTTAVSFSCSFSQCLPLDALQYLEPSIMPKQVKQTYNYLPNVLLNYSSDCSVSVLLNTGQITEGIPVLCCVLQ